MQSLRTCSSSCLAASTSYVVAEVVDDALEKVDIVRDHVEEDMVRVLDIVLVLDMARM
jgi:hypothetical protein